MCVCVCVCVCVCASVPESQSGSLFASLIVSVAMVTALAAQCEVEEELVVLSVMEKQTETGFTKGCDWSDLAMMSCV